MSTFARTVTAYRQVLSGLDQLVRQLDDAQWQAPTECPGWSVADVYAHVLELERWIVAGSEPFDGAFQRYIDASVDTWRGRPRPETVAVLADTVAARHGQLAQAAAEQIIWSPVHGREVTAAQMLPIRVFDLWTHEQDIRRAVRVPGGLGSPAAVVTRNLILNQLPRTVVRAGQAPAGSTVRLTTLGPVPTDVAVHVDADGRGALAPTSARPATAHITMGWESFARLSTGRGTRGTHQVWLGGDRALAERVADHLNIAP